MKNFKKLFASAAILLFVLISQSTPVKDAFSMPARMEIYEHEATALFTVSGSAAVLQTPQKYSMGASRIKKNVLNNVIPFKTVDVTAIKTKEVYLGGQSVGVAMYTDGLLVVDTVSVPTKGGTWINPSEKAGIKKGDYILYANGEHLTGVSMLDKIVSASGGNPVQISIKRGQNQIVTEILPVDDNGAYKLGLWLRDSTAGIGTVTYVNADTNEFAALGHPVSDPDTGVLLTVGDGRIVECSITNVIKGTRGTPGELKGGFSTSAGILGKISKNTEFGLKGTVNSKFEVGRLIPLGSRALVHEGEATVVSTVDTKGIKEYKIEIIHVNTQNSASPKSMVIHVTDPELLEKTGGIVQGMSGSPIIQDGKLIGAVTHVMVSDPTRGYGVFIEWMMK